MIRRFGTVLVAACLLASLLSVQPVSADPGTLDTTFGGVGYAVLNTANYERAHGVAVDALDRVLIAGECSEATGTQFCVVRYTAAGILDTSFDSDGIVKTDINNDALDDIARAIEVDGSGRVVVAGECTVGTQAEICVVRYLPDGSLDNSFSADGVVTTDVSIGYDEAFDLEIDSDGNIVVAGQCRLQFCVVRYTPSGALDSSFSGDGMVITDVVGRALGDWAQAVTIDAVGRIIVAGRCYTATVDTTICMARYTPTGVLDTTFDTDGMVLTNVNNDAQEEVASAVTTDASGRIIVAGSCEVNNKGQTCVVRYTAAGALDPTFDTDGAVHVDINNDGLSDGAYGVEVAADGSIVTAGLCNFAGRDHFCIMRLTGSGELDSTLGGDGTISTDLANDSQSDWASGIALDSGGRIVAGGTCGRIYLNLCAARYLPVSIVGLPSAPVAASAAPGDRRATVSWTAPEDDGGAPVSTYVATATPGGFTCTSATTTCEVLGLTNGASYTFAVTASNGNGPGPASPPTAAVVPFGRASRPVDVTAVAGDTQATVSWDPPLSDGGRPITSYRVVTSPASDGCTTPSTSCVITGLTNGRPYSVWVTPVTLAGDGYVSISNPTVTPFGLPQPPAAASAQPGNGEATITWTVPNNDGGSAIIGYEVVAAPDGGRCSTTVVLTCTISGLPNWTSYTFSVTSTNAAGTSSTATTTAPTTPGYLPPVPTDLVVSAGGDVSWNVPDNGAPISGYVVEYRLVESLAGPAEASGVGTDLEPLIVGGESIDIADHAYGMKVLAYRNSSAVYECGAVLIAPEWALTAAHCTEFQPTGSYWAEPDYLSFVSGLTDWTDVTTENRAKHVTHSSQIYRHPDFDRVSLENDIALVRLTSPADMAHATTIPLFEANGPLNGTDGYVTGWGSTSTGSPTSSALKGTTISMDVSCGSWPSFYPEWDDQVHLCASGHPSGFCSGDSGGPLVIRENDVLLLAGIVSFSSAAGCVFSPELPDVFTRVSTYADWIEGHTGPLWSSTPASGGAGGGTAAIAGLEAGKTYAVQVHTENAFGSSATQVSRVTVPGGEVVGGPGTYTDCSLPQPHPLADVPTKSFAYNAVGCIYNLGITTGSSPTTYSPDREVTRAEMAAFIARFYDKVTGSECNGSHPFRDVSPSSFANDAIGCIYNLGVTTGKSATTYAPDDTVTREQMAAFLARFYRTATGLDCAAVPVFVDITRSSYAFEDVGCIAELGVTTGTSPSTYSPSSNVSREQMAAFLARLYITMTG